MMMKMKKAYKLMKKATKLIGECCEEGEEYEEEDDEEESKAMPVATKRMNMAMRRGAEQFELGAYDADFQGFSGTVDTVVDQKVAASLLQYYEAFIPARQITTDFDFDAEHCIPTPSYGEDCTTLSSPYIGNCGYSGAGQAFKTFYGVDIWYRQMIDANLFKFDQTPFFLDDGLNSIDDTGFIYIPTAC